MANSAVEAASLVLTPVVSMLEWQEWDGIFIVYQPSSAETHVFNETTALILRCLEQGPLSADRVKGWTEAALHIGQGELGCEDFALAVARLEEIGLVDSMDEMLTVQ